MRAPVPGRFGLGLEVPIESVAGFGVVCPSVSVRLKAYGSMILKFGSYQSASSACEPSVDDEPCVGVKVNAKRLLGAKGERRADTVIANGPRRTRSRRNERAVNVTTRPLRCGLLSRLATMSVQRLGDLIAVAVMPVEGPMSIVAVVVVVPVERPIVAVVVMPVVAVATPGRRRLACRSCQTHGKHRHRCVCCKLQHGSPPQMLAQMFASSLSNLEQGRKPRARVVGENAYQN